MNTLSIVVLQIKKLFHHSMQDTATGKSSSIARYCYNFPYLLSVLKPPKAVLWVLTGKKKSYNSYEVKEETKKETHREKAVLISSVGQTKYKWGWEQTRVTPTLSQNGSEHFGSGKGTLTRRCSS